MAITKKNFKSKLHLVCASNSWRESTHYIYFKKDYLYCTTGNIALKQKISLHGFDEKEIKLLNGKMIKNEVFKTLLRYKNIEVVSNGFRADIDEENSILFKFSNYNDEVDFVELIEGILKDGPNEGAKEICINPYLLKNLTEAFVSSTKHIKLKFRTMTQGILVVPAGNPWEDQTGIIMPIMLQK